MSGQQDPEGRGEGKEVSQVKDVPPYGQHTTRGGSRRWAGGAEEEIKVNSVQQSTVNTAMAY